MLGALVSDQALCGGPGPDRSHIMEGSAQLSSKQIEVDVVARQKGSRVGTVLLGAASTAARVGAAAPAPVPVSASPAEPPPTAIPKPLMRDFYLTQAEVLQVSNIDQVNGSFRAMVWLQFKLYGGVLDEDLSSTSSTFRTDENGMPTFRPSAAWYMEQLDFNHVKSIKRIDAKIVSSGDDLCINTRWEGTFFHTFYVQDFPCDQQGLTISVSFNCRTTGMVPVRVLLPPTGIGIYGVCMDEFVDPTLSVLSTLLTRPHLVGNDPQRLFPSISMTIMASRRPKYTLIHTFLPMMIFTTLSLVQFSADVKQPASILGGRAVSSLTLVLTSVAFKLSVASKLPMVSYMTLTDWYIDLSTYLIACIAAQSRLLTLWELPEQEEEANRFDRICFVVFLSVWVFIQFYHLRYVVALVIRSSDARKLHDPNLIAYAQHIGASAKNWKGILSKGLERDLERDLEQGITAAGQVVLGARHGAGQGSLAAAQDDPIVQALTGSRSWWRWLLFPQSNMFHHHDGKPKLQRMRSTAHEMTHEFDQWQPGKHTARPSVLYDANMSLRYPDYNLLANLVKQLPRAVASHAKDAQQLLGSSSWAQPSIQWRGQHRFQSRMATKEDDGDADDEPQDQVLSMASLDVGAE